MPVNWQYAIKAVDGGRADHGEFIHFSRPEYAQRLVDSGDYVLLYETGVRPGGSRCIFALGRVTGRDVVWRPREAEGQSFDYAVVWLCDLELPAGARSQGIPLARIQQATGLRLGQAPGGLHRITAEQYAFLADELRRRANALSER